MNKIYTNSQRGGRDELFKGERLENFRKKYEYFTKTLNIIRNENKNSRKLDLINNSDFCAYFNVKKLPHKFTFKNLNSQYPNIVTEFKSFIKTLNKNKSLGTLIIAMPLFIRFNEGLVMDMLFFNLSQKENNVYNVNVERFTSYKEIDITKIDETLNKYFIIEFTDDNQNENEMFTFLTTIKTYKFDHETINIQLDDIQKSVIYSLYGQYIRFETPRQNFESLFNNTISYTTEKDIIDFDTKINLLKDFGLETTKANININRNIVKSILERPDKLTIQLLKSLNTTFDQIREAYNDFDTNAIDIEEVTLQIEQLTQNIIDLYEEKKIFYNDLKKQREQLNKEIDNLYTEFVEIKENIVFGMDTIIQQRGLISEQLKKFKNISNNANFSGKKKAIFDKIEENLKKMITQQQQYDNQINELNIKLTEKKKKLNEKIKEVEQTKKELETSEQGLEAIKKKLKHHTNQNGGMSNIISSIISKQKNKHSKMKNINISDNKNKNIHNIINKMVGRKVNKQNFDNLPKSNEISKNKKLIKLMKTMIGGNKKLSLPEKLNRDLKEIVKQKNKQNHNNKTKISKVIDEMSPLIIQYSDNIQKYGQLLTEREHSKKSLQQSYILLRKFDTEFKESIQKLDTQKQNLINKIDKINQVIEKLENDKKPKEVVNKVKEHKEKLLLFLRERGDYTQKVKMLNKSIKTKKSYLDKAKNEVKNQMNTLKKTGNDLDLIKKELEAKTQMYGGSILNHTIQILGIKKDKYLNNLANPIENIIKGGKLSNISKNHWIYDEPNYIFQNFTFDELKKIAVEWGIKDIRKFKTKKDLAVILKLLLYSKVNLIKNWNDLIFIAKLFGINTYTIKKGDIGKLTQLINKKYKKIPINNNVQTGGGIWSADVYKFLIHNTTERPKEKIIVHINDTKDGFIKELKKHKESLGAQWQMIGGPNILGRLEDEAIQAKAKSIDLIKNNELNKSYKSTPIKLADLDIPFASRWENAIKHLWIKGSYLNESKLDSSTIHPQEDYIKIGKEEEGSRLNIKSLITAIHQSNNSALAIQSAKILALIRDPEKKDDLENISDILQKHLEQMANIKSKHLNPFIQNVKSQISNPDFEIYQSLPFSDDINTFFDEVIQKKMREAIDKFDPEKEYGVDIIIKTRDGLPPMEYKSGKNGGRVIGFNKNKDLNIYDPDATLQNGDKISDTLYPEYNKKKVIRNFPLKNVSIKSYSIDLFSDAYKSELDKIQMSGGAGVELSGVNSNSSNWLQPYFYRDNESLVSYKAKGVTSDDEEKLKEIKELKPDEFDFRSRGENLMNREELSESLHLLGKLLIELNQTSKLKKKKNKIGLFNVLKDTEDFFIDRDSLQQYLIDLEEHIDGYNETDEKTKMSVLIHNIRTFYKGDSWSGVIKSQKMKLIEEIEKLALKSKHVPALQKEIARFIPLFKKSLLIQQKRLLDEDKKIKTLDLSDVKGPTKSSILETFIKNIEFIVYKKNSDGTIDSTKFNFDQIPIDNSGQREIRMFVNTIRTVLEQVLRDEGDIRLIDIIIQRLKLLLRIIDAIKYDRLKAIPDYIKTEFKSISSVHDVERVLDLIPETEVDENGKPRYYYSKDSSTRLARPSFIPPPFPNFPQNAQQEQPGIQREPGDLRKLKNVQESKKFPQRGGIPLSGDLVLIIMPPLDRIPGSLGHIPGRIENIHNFKQDYTDYQTEIDAQLRQLQPPVTWDNANINQLHTAKDMAGIDTDKSTGKPIEIIENLINKMIINLEMTKQDIMVRLYDLDLADVTLNKGYDSSVTAYPIFEYINDDLGEIFDAIQRLEFWKDTPPNFLGSVTNPDMRALHKDYETEAIPVANRRPGGPTHDPTISAPFQYPKIQTPPAPRRRKDIPPTSYANMLISAIGIGPKSTIGGALQKYDTMSLIIRNLDNKVKNVIGGSPDLTNEEMNIAESLTKIESNNLKERLEILDDPEIYNVMKKDTPPLINRRKNQLREIDFLRKNISDVNAKIGGDKKYEDNLIEQVNNMRGIVSNNLHGIVSTKEISETIYNIIRSKFKLPSYHQVSDLEFVLMIGHITKFENLWKKDTNIVGNYETYITSLLDGTLFSQDTSVSNASDYDIGKLDDEIFLEKYYTSLNNYIKKNKFNSFEDFLTTTYKEIFPKNSENLNMTEYGTLWSKAMADIGKEWDKKMDQRKFTGADRWISLTIDGPFTKIEKALLFSFITHAKALLNQGKTKSMNKLDLNPKQKFNQFAQLIPLDTTAFMILTIDDNIDVNKPAVQIGGASSPFPEIKMPPASRLIDDRPGSFYLQKNLDHMRYLYIYDKKCRKQVLKSKNPVYTHPLHIPHKDFQNVLDQGIGLRKTGKLNTVKLPIFSEKSQTLKKCAEYRLKNTKEKYNPNWTIWELQKQSITENKFIPLILWNKNDLNFIEKKVLGEIGKTKKEVQKYKYKALRDLIEIGDFKFPTMGHPIVDLDNNSKTTVIAPLASLAPLAPLTRYASDKEMPTDEELKNKPNALKAKREAIIARLGIND